jgi:acrylyl-CoA reductase (NADPH)
VPFNAYVLSKSEEGEGAPEGEPGALQGAVTRLDLGDLPEGDVLVAVEWSVINFKDAMVTRPGNRVARRYPLVPGVELAGSVVESDDGSFAPGQRVLVQGYDLGVAHHGGFAGYARVPAEWVVPLPDDLTPRTAMIIGIAGFTAVLSLHRLRQHGLSPSSGPILVTGASGGVGSTTVALLAHHGFEVVASSGKPAEHGYLTRLGASRVLGRAFAPEGGRTLGPQLWAGVVDCVGGTALADALRTTRYGGAVAASGLTGGSELTTTVYPFIVRGVALLGIDTVATPIAARRSLWSAMASEFPVARAEEMVSEEIDLDELGGALERALDGATHGRILVRPESARPGGVDR